MVFSRRGTCRVPSQMKGKVVGRGPPIAAPELPWRECTECNECVKLHAFWLRGLSKRCCLCQIMPDYQRKRLVSAIHLLHQRGWFLSWPSQFDQSREATAHLGYPSIQFTAAGFAEYWLGWNSYHDIWWHWFEQEGTWHDVRIFPYFPTLRMFEGTCSILSCICFARHSAKDNQSGFLQYPSLVDNSATKCWSGWGLS